MGSHQAAGSFPAPREFHPPAGSLLAALTCYDGLITLDFMTGQEYHYPHCRLSP